MEPNSPNLVGQRIRALRERQELSLRALAARCDLSINAISQIERGENSPTVASLHQLAGALGVSITELFRGDHEHAVVFIPAAARLSTESNGVRMESLGIGLPYQQLQPFLVTIEPGAGSADQPVLHEGEEFVYCLVGKIEYRIGPETYHLDAGDTLLFDSSRPHSFFNGATQPASCLLIFLGHSGRARAQQLHIQPARDNGG
jgi:transcriptional regulator with XRE-family HTH domain